MKLKEKRQKTNKELETELDNVHGCLIDEKIENANLRHKLRLNTSPCKSLVKNEKFTVCQREVSVKKAVINYIPNTVNKFSAGALKIFSKSKPIGSGCFGVIRVGILVDLNVAAAVKEIHKKNKFSIFHEAKVMKHLSASGHKSFPFLYGIYDDKIVTEFIGSCNYATSSFAAGSTLRQVLGKKYLSLTLLYPGFFCCCKPGGGAIMAPPI